MSERSEKISMDAENKPKPIKDSIRPLCEPPVLKGAMKQRYIGVLTSEEAEHWIKQCQSTDFRLYHKWIPGEKLHLYDRLPLVVVYNSYYGIISHYLVRTTGRLKHSNTGYYYFIELYFIEKYGPSFKNLSDLINFCIDTPIFDHQSGEIEVFSQNHKCKKDSKK